MTTTPQADLAALRSLAEEGRYTPLGGGRYLVFYGGLVVVINLVSWLTTLAPELSPSIKNLILIALTAMTAPSIAVFLKINQKTEAKASFLSKAEALVWSTSGIAIGLYIATVTLRGVLGLETPTLLLGLAGTVAFLHYSVAFFVTAGLSNQTWLRIPAAGSMLAAIIVGLIADSDYVMPVVSLFVFVLTVLPGAVMMRAERQS